MVLENSDFFIRCHLFWAYWTALKSLKFHLCLPFFRYVAIFKEVFHLFSGYCPFLINLSVLPRIATVLSTANSKCFSITTKKKSFIFITREGSLHSLYWLISFIKDQCSWTIYNSQTGPCSQWSQTPYLPCNNCVNNTSHAFTQATLTTFRKWRVRTIDPNLSFFVSTSKCVSTHFPKNVKQISGFICVKTACVPDNRAVT